MHMVPWCELSQTGKPREPEDSWLLGPGVTGGVGVGEPGWIDGHVLKLDKDDGLQVL